MKTLSKVNVPPPLVQPLGDTNRAIALIAEVTQQSIQTVKERLYQEEICHNSNVSRNFRDYGLQPHVWSDGLSKFYAETDSFLYESLVKNRSSIKLKMRNWIGNYLSRKNTSGLKILCLGDGLGFDSLYLAQAGHDVTYFEVSGYCESFARKIIKTSGYNVTFITDINQIPQANYDVVMCLDVLEHLPNPCSCIASISSYLRPGGEAIINAPFYLISQDYLTHLKSNQKYSGKLNIFEKEGLEIVDGEISWTPIVLRKQDKNIQKHHQKKMHLLALRLVGLYIALAGIIWDTPLKWIHLYQWAITLNSKQNSKYWTDIN